MILQQRGNHGHIVDRHLGERTLRHIDGDIDTVQHVANVMQDRRGYISHPNRPRPFKQSSIQRFPFHLDPFPLLDLMRERSIGLFKLRILKDDLRL